MKVLIVDDREDNRLLLREQLRVLDAETVTAESGVRALREMRSAPYAEQARRANQCARRVQWPPAAFLRAERTRH